MKKLLASALALTMALSVGTTALAAGNSTIGVGDKDIDVTAKYNDASTTDTVYSVDIAWEDMTFTYNESGSKVWDPATHTYTDNTTASWDKTTADITVTNHSNAAVDVTMTYAAQGDFGISGALSNATFNLAAGVEGDYDHAASQVATLTISGTPNATVTAEGITVGTITVTIA